MAKSKGKESVVKRTVAYALELSDALEGLLKREGSVALAIGIIDVQECLDSVLSGLKKKRDVFLKAGSDLVKLHCDKDENGEPALKTLEDGSQAYTGLNKAEYVKAANENDDLYKAFLSEEVELSCDKQIPMAQLPKTILGAWIKVLHPFLSK